MTATEMRRPPAGSRQVTTSINLAPEVHARLRRLAAERDRSLSYLVRQAIDTYLAFQDSLGAFDDDRN